MENEKPESLLIYNRSRPMRFRRFFLAVFGLATTAQAWSQPPLPARADLTPQFARYGLVAQSQGADTCSLHAIASLAEFELAKRDAGQEHQRSTEFLIWAARKATGKSHDQAMFYEAVLGLNGLGICRESLMPDTANDHARTPSAAALADAKQQCNRWKAHWIKRWDLKRPMSDQQLQALKVALARGHPAACGLRWPKTLKGYELIDVPPPSAVEDGHSIALVGYVDAAGNSPGKFLFRNSWGPKWGKNGYGAISFAYVRTYANDAVWLELGPPGSEVPLQRFQAEALPVVASGRCPTHAQDMSEWEKALWTNGRQLFCGAEKEGFVEVAMHVTRPGRYRVRVLATAGPDFGTIRVALDGKWLPPHFDLYCGRVSPAGSLELGSHDLTSGQHRLRFMSIGKNAGSTGFCFGLDAIDLLSAAAGP
jgi:hypothetical protein